MINHIHDVLAIVLKANYPHYQIILDTQGGPLTWTGTKFAEMDSDFFNNNVFKTHELIDAYTKATEFAQTGRLSGNMQIMAVPFKV